MKISAQFTFWASLLFAVGCIAYAGFGFSSIDASMTEAVRDAARGYAWFWMFLGGIGVVAAVVSGLMLRGRLGPLDE